MQPELQTLLLVCPLVMLAGFVDAVAGGGGLISLPVYYLAGLPVATAAGTNKLSATMGTTLATWRYYRSGKVDGNAGIPAALGALLCSMLGVALMKAIPENAERILVMCCIPVAAVFTLKGRGQRREQERSARQIWLLAAAVGCVIGFYDGLVGPGTGTFLILLFVQLLGMDEVRASGTAKLVNLASNVAALCSLALSGNVLVWLGVPAGLCAMIGAYGGSKLAIQKGSRAVRAVMLCVLALLLGKLLWDMIGNP